VSLFTRPTRLVKLAAVNAGQVCYGNCRSEWRLCITIRHLPYVTHLFRLVISGQS
jgi:hypothetical protein